MNEASNPARFFIIAFAFSWIIWGIAIIMTWFHNNTKASILTALLAHALINSMSELFVFDGGGGGASYNYYAVTQLVIAGVIVVIWGAKTLTRTR